MVWYINFVDNTFMHIHADSQYDQDDQVTHLLVKTAQAHQPANDLYKSASPSTNISVKVWYNITQIHLWTDKYQIFSSKLLTIS